MPRDYTFSSVANGDMTCKYVCNLIYYLLFIEGGELGDYYKLRIYSKNNLNSYL